MPLAARYGLTLTDTVVLTTLLDLVDPSPTDRADHATVFTATELA